jgi:hypothetical protein
MLHRILTLLIAFSVTAQIPLPDQTAYRCLVTGEVRVGTCCQRAEQIQPEVKSCAGCENGQCQARRSLYAATYSAQLEDGSCGCCESFIIEGNEPTPIAFVSGPQPDHLIPNFHFLTAADPIVVAPVTGGIVTVRFAALPPPDPSDIPATLCIFLL